MDSVKYVVCSIIFVLFFQVVFSCNNNPIEDTNEDPGDTITQIDPGDTVTQTPWEYDSPFSFNQQPVKELLAMPKKVFAHYFTPFPISLDNKAPDSDYYETGYLSPSGENSKHLSYGGYLRSRPLPRSPRTESDWKAKDMEEEVKRAVALGIDGFACDLLSGQGYVYYDRVVMLMKAAEKIAPEFKILLMPDMEAFKNATDKVAGVVKALSLYSAAYRLDDGRLVVSPFNTQVKDADWWKSWLQQMKADGVDIAFIPLFQGWGTYAPTFAPISYGMSDWGWRSVSGQSYWVNTAQKAHGYVTKWMMPVAPQDMRPKNTRVWEAKNSEEYRVMWENAIFGGSDWVHLITWNDYSEHTHIAPSTGTQYSFYDLTAYYVSWFKTGEKPTIVRDVLYYFYRKHSASAQATKQEKQFEFDVGSDAPSNQIELVTFLTAPGTLEIEIMGKKTKKEAIAGVNILKIPLETGRPVFRLIRNGKTMINLPGAFKINNEIAYQNLMYCGGSNSRLPVSEP